MNLSIQNPAGAAFLLAALLVAAVVGLSILPVIFAANLRAIFQQWPEARELFIGKGTWISFSKRFGLPWIISLLIAAFGWLLSAIRLVPDTMLGAWLLFGPTFTLMLAGIALGTLRVMRFIAAE